jgi:ELWxxDGT repeat protein
MLKPALSLLYLALSLQAAALQAAAVPRLVADLNASLSGGDSSGVQEPLVPLGPLGEKVLFAAHDASSGLELWQSDGTSLGTAIVSDLCAGSCSSTPKLLGTAGRVALFDAAFDRIGSPVNDLWRTDGTRQGTFRIATDLSLCDADHLQAAEIGGVLVFPATTGIGQECNLWRSDGTPGGTGPLLSLGSVFGGVNPLVEDPVRAGNRLFFLVPEFGKISLWASDGTAATLLRSFPWDNHTFSSHPRLVTALGARVFFLASAVESGDEELWTSDGTPAGTRPVTQFAAPFPFRPTRFLKALDGVLYFVADDIRAGGDLFRSDGTAAGTRRVTDFGFASPFGEGEGAIGADQLAKAGNLLVFPATDGLTGWRLWTSGGTPATTAPLTGCPGDCPGVYSGTLLAAAGRRIVLTGTDAAHGTELWSTDGTGPHTERLGDFCPGRCSSSPASFFPWSGKLLFLAGTVGTGPLLGVTDGTAAGTSQLGSFGNQTPFFPFTPVVAGGKLFFTARDPVHGSQLWTSDGTSPGTGFVTLIGSGKSSLPFELTPLGSGLAFRACDGESSHVWRSDGTAAGTAPLSPPRSCGSSLHGLIAAGGLLFFLDGEFQPFQLWRSDGTEAGTFPVSPPGDDDFGDLVAFQGKAVFTSALHASNTYSLWESDGTPAGTRLIVTPDVYYIRPGLRVLGGKLYFLASSTTTGEQLWVSDGTAAGTRQLTSLQAYAFDPQTPPEMTVLGNIVYFFAAGQLWKTDGTVAGTAAVTSAPSGQTGLTAFQGALYFVADTSQGKVGRGLWRSDGTAAGAVLVKAAGSRFDQFRPDSPWLTPVGNQLFFAADDGDHGVELWRTDGTPDGTVLVRDIAPGSAASQPESLAAAGGRLYFSAHDGVHGVELWQSDGTAAGTHMVRDIAPGSLSAHPEELTVSGNQLFFRADDAVHGEELWALDLAGAPGCQPSDEALCLGGGRYRVEASWRDFQGHSGRGHAAALTADTGTFWFFDPANIEAVVKVLDGHGVNGHDWVFYGALSNVEYDLTVTDTQTGAARLYRNPPGRLASVADTFAFGPQGATGAGTSLGPAGIPAAPIVTAGRSLAKAGCVPSAARLCLQGGRFAVEVLHWRDFQNRTGTGTAVPLTGDTGTFWFFDAANVELLVKVLDGRPFNGKFWVFYGALSNVEYTLRVTDTQTGKAKTYSNPRGRLASVADTSAF